MATVQARHRLLCGVVTAARDWNREDLHGNLAPLGEAICRAVAVLVHPQAAQITRLPAEPEAPQALQSGQLDVVADLAPSISTGLRSAVAFGPAIFWDSQTFMVHKASGISAAADLAGQPVCYMDGTDAAQTLLAAMHASGIRIIAFPPPSRRQARWIPAWSAATATPSAPTPAGWPKPAPSFTLWCTISSSSPTVSPSPHRHRHPPGRPGLERHRGRHRRRAGPGSHARHHPRQPRSPHHSEEPVIQHLRGINWSAGLALSLPRNWSAQVIAASGNYAEIDRRSVGQDSALGVPPGLTPIACMAA